MCGVAAAILNIFGGILVQKRRAEVALEESGLKYVIVRPGGMERPTDTYKQTHNVTLGLKDTLFGGQVSRLQVAELVAAAVANPDLTENKVWRRQSLGFRGYSIAMAARKHQSTAGVRPDWPGSASESPSALAV
jgi:hypothetical protein